MFRRRDNTVDGDIVVVNIYGVYNFAYFQQRIWLSAQDSVTILFPIVALLPLAGRP